MKNAQKGQALLIIVLVMVVVLTVGLSAASRSIVNIRTTTEEENSQKAFSAAEAGVERALKNGQGVTGNGINFDNAATIKQVAVTTVGGSEFVLHNQDNPLKKDDGAEIWLANHDGNGKITNGNRFSGNLTILWGTGNDVVCNNAALDIVVFSGTGDSPVTTRYTADPCSSRGNNFTPQVGGGQANFAYGKTLSITDGILVRVVPLYTSTPIGIKATSSLPSQGKQIDSTGQSADTFRKISYFQGYPKCSSEFCQHILFVPKSL